MKQSIVRPDKTTTQCFLRVQWTPRKILKTQQKPRERRKEFKNYLKELQGAALRIPNPIAEYNSRMRGADVHAQLQSYYSTHHSLFRVWWPLFFFIIDAAIVNAWVLSRMEGGKFLHRDF